MKVKLHLFVIIVFLHSCKSSENMVWETPSIISMSFSGTKVLQTEISDAERRITIWVPYQTNLTSLVPTIVTKNTLSIIPSSDVVQNFSTPKYYTLVSESGQKVSYEIQVKPQEQPVPLITSASMDTIEAGMSFQIRGRYFGLNPTEVQASMLYNGSRTELKKELLDSLNIKVYTKDDLSPGNYLLSLKIKNKESSYTKPITVEYPSPIIDSADYWNIIQTEEIRISGKYLSKNYSFDLLLIGLDGKSMTLPSISIENMLACVVPKSIDEGSYHVKIINTSLKKESQLAAQQLMVYRNDMPYLIDTEGNSNTRFKRATTVAFSTKNFEKIPARFYQIQLENGNMTIIQNALYNAENGKLKFETPSTSGTFKISLILSNELNILYQINTRLVLTMG